ncbi:hypothetical protein BN8_02868 [Fibrisoma limi BUZ 3]|uniref:Uncharacterized protein n=1 Tax=Fibrisoma limi BUZ 3 TaxID=1185876 RepID=I2GIM2_9BACT|nr:hypothetical protein [Fibrisoma limi]CCH53747.1 hypothetical protein BN8_02868 [Fibrisoma limi BUZ 3]
MNKYYSHFFVKACLVCLLFSSNQLLAQQWSASGGNVYVMPGVRVGIGTIAPSRSLHVTGEADQYIRVSSYGGTLLSNHAAGLELQRIIPSGGPTSNWSIVNEDHLRFRHNGELLFQMTPSMALLGKSLSEPTVFTVYGTNITRVSNTIQSGALRLYSKVGDNQHLLALDGNQIESSDPLYINNDSEQNVHLANGGGKVKVGTTDNEARFSVASESDMQLKLINPGNGGAAWRIGVANSGWAAGDGKLVFSKTASSADATMVITPAGKVGIGLTTPSETLQINGTTSTKVLKITGGADFAEHFDIGPDKTILPGTVVSIDPAKPGQLRVARQAYDKTVAGIVSGAGDVQPGMLMGQAGTLASGQHPVALTGRVYCRVDAQYGAIRPGDLLTTSPTAGHAMKASDGGQAQGAILGKAMTALDAGTGLVLVLVSLQ